MRDWALASLASSSELFSFSKRLQADRHCSPRNSPESGAWPQPVVSTITTAASAPAGDCPGKKRYCFHCIFLVQKPVELNIPNTPLALGFVTRNRPQGVTLYLWQCNPVLSGKNIPESRRKLLCILTKRLHCAASSDMEETQPQTNMPFLAPTPRLARGWSSLAAGKCRCSTPVSRRNTTPSAKPPGLFDISHMGEFLFDGPDAAQVPEPTF